MRVTVFVTIAFPGSFSSGLSEVSEPISDFTKIPVRDKRIVSHEMY